MFSKDIRLRPLERSDASTVATLANNREIWLNLRDRFPHPYSMQDAEWYINYVLDNEVEIVLGITYEGDLVGVIGVIKLDDVYSQGGDLGYWLGQPYWGKGIMTGALELFTTYCKDHLKLRRLEAGVFGSNLGSMRVLEKNGFKREGIRSSRIIKDGQEMDEHMFGLLLPNK